MSISIFELFSIGIGPSSSHTVGPMRAAKSFALALQEQQLLDQIQQITIELYGSLGHTGKGHGSDKAVILGLMGLEPESVDTDAVPDLVKHTIEAKVIRLLSKHALPFHYHDNIIFHRKLTLDKHPNGMRFIATCGNDKVILSKTYFSVGGGFIIGDASEASPFQQAADLPFPFSSGDELLQICQSTGYSIAKVMLENERQWHSEEDINRHILNLWQTMQQCVDRGCKTEGILPGGLKVVRRAPAIYRKLKSDPQSKEAMAVMDWVDLYALAVNEENAAGGRIVTAPTNGAAGIIPAVLKYHQTFYPQAIEEDIQRFFLTAGAIGILYKINASISGAEVGCQGEVGVACSMAAAGLTEVMGGSPEQIENAAEIGMEHNLGLTCDPVGGLVQVPCIERNAMGAVKAINASRLALRGDGKHKVSLDKVIKTMRQTGADMQSKYKETARGGLAVNIIEC